MPTAGSRRHPAVSSLRRLDHAGGPFRPVETMDLGRRRDGRDPLHEPRCDLLTEHRARGRANVVRAWRSVDLPEHGFECRRTNPFLRADEANRSHSRQGRTAFLTAPGGKDGWVAFGECSPKAPTDPYVRNSRIRFLKSRSSLRDGTPNGPPPPQAEGTVPAGVQNATTDRSTLAVDDSAIFVRAGSPWTESGTTPCRCPSVRSTTGLFASPIGTGSGYDRITCPAVTVGASHGEAGRPDCARADPLSRQTPARERQRSLRRPATTAR